MPLTSRSDLPFVRTIVVSAMLFLVLAAIGFIAREDIYRYGGVDPKLVLATLFTLALAGITLLLQLYLRGAIFTPLKDKDGIPIDIPSSLELRREIEKSNAETRSEIEKLRNHFTNLQFNSPTGSAKNLAGKVDTDQILASLRAHVNDTLISEIESRLQQSLRQDFLLQEANVTFEASARRLQLELSELTRRANVNLLIGVVTTVIAVSLLVYMVLTAAVTFADWTALLTHYIPRIATVAFIEIFSFFFLRLYRSSLADIKYYQNELTLLDTSRIALHVSQMQNDSKSTLIVVNALTRSDRNRDTPAFPDTELNSKEIKDFMEAFEKLAKLSTGLLRKERLSKGSEG